MCIFLYEFLLVLIYDVYVIAEHHNLPNILNDANSTYSSLQLTIEYETDHQILFFNILIEKCVGSTSQTIITSVYRKSTFSWQYLNFYSEYPKSHIIAVIKTLFTRSLHYCSTEELFNTEKQRILLDLKSKGSLTRLCNLIFFELLRALMNTPPPFQRTKINQFATIPYYKCISEDFAFLKTPWYPHGLNPTETSKFFRQLQTHIS